jgi:hypothetical protein
MNLAKSQNSPLFSPPLLILDSCFYLHVNPQTTAKRYTEFTRDTVQKNTGEDDSMPPLKQPKTLYYLGLAKYVKYATLKTVARNSCTKLHDLILSRYSLREGNNVVKVIKLPNPFKLLNLRAGLVWIFLHFKLIAQI